MKRRDVTPTSEANNVKYPSLSKKRKDIIISVTDEHHSIISDFEKYFAKDLLQNIKPPEKKHPHTHLQRPNDVYTDAFFASCYPVAACIIFYLLYYTAAEKSSLIH